MGRIGTVRTSFADLIHTCFFASLSLSLKIASQHQSLLSLLGASRSAIYKTQEIWKFYEWFCMRFWADFIVYMSVPATAAASVRKADEVHEWMVVLFFLWQLVTAAVL